MANRGLDDEWIERRLCELFEYVSEDRARIQKIIIEQRLRYPDHCEPLTLLARCVEQLLGFSDIRFRPDEHTAMG